MEIGTRGEGVLGFRFSTAFLPRFLFFRLLFDELGLHLMQRGYVISFHEALLLL